MTAAEMQEVVRDPDRWTQHRRGEHGGFVYEFVRQRGSETLTVVAEVKKTECWLITAWRD